MNSMNIRLYNAKILTMEPDRPIFEGEIWIRDERIVAVISEEESQQEVRRELQKKWQNGTQKKTQMEAPEAWDLEYDCGRNLLMPGFKNAHTHSPMTFLRSYADDLPLERWLYDKIFPMEAQLSSEDIYELTKLAVLEYISGGITSIFDMYVDSEAVARACVEMGMRCVLVPGLNNFVSSTKKVETEYVRLNQMDPLISYRLGFHAEYTCSEELLRGVAQLAHHYKAPVYMHLAETVKEVKECQARYGMTPAVFLDSLGIFDYGGGGFHCVHMSDEDMKVFQERGLYVVTNPASNLKLASGIAPIAEYVKRRIPVAIGTDGPASNNSLDMFKEMYLVATLSKVRESDAASLNPDIVLNMATVQGAGAMGLENGDRLAPGKLADLILIDLHQPNMQPNFNCKSNLVYSAGTRNVKLTMIHGKIVFENGKFLVGEGAERIYETCNRILKKCLAKQK